MTRLRDRQVIVDGANQLLKGVRLRSLPVNVHEIAHSLGAKVQLVSEPGMNGLFGHVSLTTSELIVSLNAEDDVAEQHFTLAHELAHTLFFETPLRRLPIEKPKSHQALEHYCDSVAAEILIPSGLFEPLVWNKPISLLAMAELAERFQAPLQAIAIQWSNCASRYVELACWAVSEDRLRLRWVVGDTKISDAGDERLGSLALDGNSGPARALHTSGAVVTIETSADGASYLVESLAFTERNIRLVITLSKPAISAFEPAGVQQVLAARARGLRRSNRQRPQSTMQGRPQEIESSTRRTAAEVG